MDKSTNSPGEIRRLCQEGEVPVLRRPGAVAKPRQLQGLATLASRSRRGEPGFQMFHRDFRR